VRNDSDNEKLPFPFANGGSYLILLYEIGPGGWKVDKDLIENQPFHLSSLTVKSSLEEQESGQKLILGSECQVWLLYWIMSLCRVLEVNSIPNQYAGTLQVNTKQLCCVCKTRQ